MTSSIPGCHINVYLRNDAFQEIDIYNVKSKSSVKSGDALISSVKISVRLGKYFEHFKENDIY